MSYKRALTLILFNGLVLPSAAWAQYDPLNAAPAPRLAPRAAVPAQKSDASSQAAEKVSTFETAQDRENRRTDRAVEEISVFGECDDTDFSQLKAEYRTGAEQGQAGSAEVIAGLRAAGMNALADKMAQQRAAYDVETRVAQIGGTNGCKTEAKPKPKTPKPPAPKTPLKGPKGPKVPPRQDSKAPGDTDGTVAQQQTPPPSRTSSPTEVGRLETQINDVQGRLDDARARYQEIERQEQEARAQGRTPRERTYEDERLRRDILYMEDQLRSLRTDRDNQIRGLGKDPQPYEGDIRDRMLPGLTPDEQRNLPQRQPNEIRTTQELRRDLERENLDAQRRLKDAQARYDEIVRQEQAAIAEGRTPRQRTAEDEQIRREIEYQQGRLNSTSRDLREIAEGAQTTRDLEDKAASTQRRLDEAVRLRENAARQREAAIARGETPPDTSARDRDLDREINRMRGEIQDLDDQLSQANPGRARPITDPNTGATMRMPAPKPKP